MRKKYLSALLFGALLFASAGTFTSCKDYDDDINNLQTQINDVKAAVTELQAKVESGKYVTDVSKEGDGIKITWNDNSSSVIETIKGADGTVVTMGENGNWFIDGKDTGVSYKAEQSESGVNGHDAQISEDGYWMVWDAEAGEYVKTQYVAGGVIAVETTGGWNLTVNDETGATQTIFVPSSSTMGYIDVLGNDLANYPTSYGLANMKALYGINEKDVEYGPADAKKTLQKGLYTTLDRDLMIVVNPQGTDASDYTFSLTNSGNQSTGLIFKDAVPYEGVLSRATSANGVWVLPHDFTRYEDIEDARTKNYLLFKANDGAKHALSLTATLSNTTVKTPYDLGASLKKIGEVKVYVNELTNCAVNQEYIPTYATNSVDANAVYDYWLTFEQSADNLKAVELYGAKIVNDGHAFTYTRETGVNNHVRLVYNYILMDGTIVQGDKAPMFYALMREEMATEHTVTLERLKTPMDAEYVDGKDVKFLNGTKWSSNRQVFALNTEAYSLAKLLSDMSDVEKAVWNSAIANSQVSFSIIGGEGNNNEYDWNFGKGYNVLYAFNKANDEVTFQFLVSAGYPVNFLLNNAYQLTMTVNDEDTGTPVASIILPFEFIQPTLDITRENGEKAIWNEKKNVLSIYGDKVVKEIDGEKVIYMHVPFYEAFTTAYEKQYSKFVPTAQYYTLSCAEDVDPSFNYWGYTVLGKDYQDLENEPLTRIVYSGNALQWNTYTNHYIPDAAVPVKADYTFYGVYPATDEQVSDFTLRFASLLGDATSVKANGEFTSNNVTREVILTDADFTLTDALGDTFYLFDGVKSDGNVDKRSDMNLRQGFEEGTEGFETDFTLATTIIEAYYYRNGSKVGIPVTVGSVGTGANAELVENANTKTRAWEPGTISATDVIVTDLPAEEAIKPNYAAIPGGIMIQLPSFVGTTEPVTIEFQLVDVFGVTKTLSVTVKAAK